MLRVPVGSYQDHTAVDLAACQDPSGRCGEVERSWLARGTVTGSHHRTLESWIYSMHELFGSTPPLARSHCLPLGPQRQSLLGRCRKLHCQGRSGVCEGFVSGVSYVLLAISCLACYAGGCGCHAKGWKLMASSRRVWIGPRTLRKLELVRQRRTRPTLRRQPVAGARETLITICRKVAEYK